MKLGECRKCHAEIGWIVTRATGRQMPIDPTPNPRGNVICQVDGDGVIRGTVRTATDTSPRPPGVAFMPHFATCAARPQSEPKPPKPPAPAPPPSLFDQGGSDE